jgi:hypothetical protein
MEHHETESKTCQNFRDVTIPLTHSNMAYKLLIKNVEIPVATSRYCLPDLLMVESR